MDSDGDAGLGVRANKLDLRVGHSDAAVGPIEVFRIPAPAFSFAVKAEMPTQRRILRG